MKKSKSAPKSKKQDPLTTAAIAIGSTLGIIAKKVGLVTPAKKKAKKKVAAKKAPPAKAAVKKSTAKRAPVKVAAKRKSR